MFRLSLYVGLFGVEGGERRDVVRPLNDGVVRESREEFAVMIGMWRPAPTGGGQG
jgi:hypothetical protein